jgi:hypothetical protein
MDVSYRSPISDEYEYRINSPVFVPIAINAAPYCTSEKLLPPPPPELTLEAADGAMSFKQQDIQTGASFEDKLSYLSASPLTQIPIRLSAVRVKTTGHVAVGDGPAAFSPGSSNMDGPANRDDTAGAIVVTVGPVDDRETGPPTIGDV